MFATMCTSNSEMVSSLYSNGTLKSVDIINTMKSVDRKNYCKPSQAEYCYVDTPLPIGYNATISGKLYVYINVYLYHLNI